MNSKRLNGARQAARRLLHLIVEAFTKDWGIKLLALLLALVIYHTLKPETGTAYDNGNDKRIFSYR
jgi:hypothetical protein